MGAEGLAGCEWGAVLLVESAEGVEGVERVGGGGVPESPGLAEAAVVAVVFAAGFPRVSGSACCVGVLGAPGAGARGCRAGAGCGVVVPGGASVRACVRDVPRSVIAHDHSAPVY